MDSMSRRRLLERLRENAREAGDARVYREAAEASSDSPDVFINVKNLPTLSDYGMDELRSMSIEERKEKYGEAWSVGYYKDTNKAYTAYKEGLQNAVIDQLNGQEEGLGDAFKRHIEEENNESFGSYVISNIVSGSPAAWSQFKFEEAQVCVVKEPSEDWDSARDFIEQGFQDRPFVSHYNDTVVENFGINDRDYLIGVGAHEGEHCNQDKDDLGNERERGSDVAEQRAVDDPSFSSAMIDYRHLNAGAASTVHSVGILLEYDQEGTEMHGEAAFYHTSKMALMVYEHYDWAGDVSKMTEEEQSSVPSEESWAYKGEEADYDELEEVLIHDPDGFFAAIEKGVEAYKAEVLSTHEKAPTLDTLRDVVRAEISIDYIQNFEAAYRRRFLGQMDIAVPAQTFLLDNVDRASFMSEQAERSEFIAKVLEAEDFDIEDYEKFAFRDFDYGPHKGYNKDYDYDALRIYKPDIYFQVLKDAEADLLHVATEDRSPEDAEVAVFLAEKVVDRVRQYEANYRTTFLGEIVPEPRRADFSSGEGEARIIKRLEEMLEKAEKEKGEEAAPQVDSPDAEDAPSAENDDVLVVGAVPPQQPASQAVKFGGP